MADPTIEFKEEKPVAEPKISKKPILVYKPTSPGQLPPVVMADRSDFFKIKKK